MSTSEQRRIPHPGVPGPADLPPPGALAFFTPQEARTVEALAATLLPGTPEDPGAREAGVVYYIDAALAYPGGFTTRTYTSPPYAVPYEGDAPPEDAVRATNVGAQQEEPPPTVSNPLAAPLRATDVIPVPRDLLDRYGPQSPLTPLHLYRMAIAAVDDHASLRFSRPFADLDPPQQEQIVDDLAANRIPLPGGVPSAAFFNLLRSHVVEGMFSDPIYRGNRDMAGWKLIGYPGAQRAYTPEELLTEGYRRPPQSMADLPGFHPQPDPGSDPGPASAGDPGDPQQS